MVLANLFTALNVATRPKQTAVSLTSAAECQPLILYDQKLKEFAVVKIGRICRSKTNFPNLLFMKQTIVAGETE